MLPGHIPLLMLDEADRPLTEPLVSRSASRRSFRGWRQRLSLTTDIPRFAYKTAQSRQRIPRFIAGLGPQAIIINVGSGRTSFGQRVVNMDIEPFSNVDAIAGGDKLPVADASVDGAITIGVLEHVPDLRSTLSEIDRVLKPGGQVYHEVPFIQGFHGSPTDFRRFTVQGVAELVKGYKILDQGVASGPSSALGWLLIEWLTLLFSFDSPVLRKVGRRVFGWLFSPLKYFDRWLESRAEAWRMACAYYVAGQKPGER